MGAPPRVVFVTDIVTPYMVAVFSELARSVELTVLFCAKSGSRGADWAFSTPFPFRHRVLGGVTIARRSGEASDLYPDPRLLSAIAAERPSAVVSGAFSFPTVAAALYGRVAGARLIIHSDGTSHSERGIGRTQRLARIVLMRAATACVGNSEPAAQRFVELGASPDRVFRAPHTTEIAPFQAVARERFSSPAGDRELTVLHVGRLIASKAVDRLLRAVELARRTVRLRLVVVGTGPDEPRLRRLATELGLADAVEFRGFVDQPDLPTVYRQADVLAFPTLGDTFGMVVVEAAAAGLPVIASPFAGATMDVVEDGRSGLVVDPHDVGEWADALVTLGRDPDLRRRLGARGHEVTLDRTPARAARGYVEAVHSAMRRGGRATG